MKWLGCDYDGTGLTGIPADLIPVILEEMKAEDDERRRASPKR